MSITVIIATDTVTAITITTITTTIPTVALVLVTTLNILRRCSLLRGFVEWTALRLDVPPN